MWDHDSPCFSKDVIEKKYSYLILAKIVPKTIPLKNNGLFRFRGESGMGEGGAPKNEGISKDIYENKGQKKSARECLEMLFKTHDLRRSSGDVVENKHVVRAMIYPDCPPTLHCLAAFHHIMALRLKPGVWFRAPHAIPERQRRGCSPGPFVNRGGSWW
jgi:hypothetical protein